MKKQILFLFISFSVFSFAPQAQHTAIHYTSAQSYHSFEAGLTKLYKSSLTLNEALISSDVKKTQQAAGEVKKVISQVDKSLLKEKALSDWMSYQKVIIASLEKIESEEKLKVQRKYFASFSQALYKSLKTFGIEETAYYQFCPMALEGEGAYWLSESKHIRNPYLGDKMLTCGSTKETLK